jgi:hypothetical protein
VGNASHVVDPRMRDDPDRASRCGQYFFLTLIVEGI